MPNALVTGISGQDGSYLAELLLEKGYTVHGYTRCESELGCSEHLRNSLTLHSFAPIDELKWGELFASTKPTEIYHLAADSFVPNGWTDPVGNVESNLRLTIRIVEAARRHSPQSKIMNACSREVFGCTDLAKANEDTPMNPITPYGVNKAASRWFCTSYREKYGMFVASAILFNHESPRRPISFVTRKITHGAARIANSDAEHLELGSVEAERDWGFAGDFVDAMWRMLQLEQAEDFVLGTGQTYSIAKFAELAFSAVGLEWKKHVVSNANFHRARDTNALAADCSKAADLLGWQPTTTLEELVQMMVSSDMDIVQKNLSDRRTA